jgi:transposase
MMIRILLLKEEKILMNKSQVSKARAAMLCFIKAFESNFGKTISPDQTNKKRNLKIDLKEKTDLKATGNKKIVWKPGEEEMLKLLETVGKNLLESGCKAVGKETARLTGVNETTISKIWNRNPENLERKKRESKDSNYSAAELDAIRDIMYQMYKDKDVPTVQSLLVKLKEKCLPFDISIASLRRLLHKIGFTYKLLNRRTSTMETQRLIRWRTEFISIIRKYRAEGRKITDLDEMWFDTHG